MKIKDKILVSAFTILVLASVFATYKRYIAEDAVVYFTDEESVPSSFDAVTDYLSE